MYLKKTFSGYLSDGTQVARRAPFLLLFVSEDPNDRRIWYCVRQVALRQCGHFMMGTAQIGTVRVTVSGMYGGDGLPKSLLKRGEDFIYRPMRVGAKYTFETKEYVIPGKYLKEVPWHISEQFWKAPGGRGDQIIRAWARDEIPVEELKPRGRRTA